MSDEIEAPLVVLPAGDDLQQEHAEAVHVLHERHRAVHGVLRRHVPAAPPPDMENDVSRFLQRTQQVF